MVKCSLSNFLSFLSCFIICSNAYGENISEDVFGSVAVRHRSEGVLNENSVEIFKFSYMPSITRPGHDAPYCSVSSVVVHGLNCDDLDHTSTNYLMIVEGRRYNNREQGGRFLSCNASSQGEGVYELSVLHESPINSERHRVLIDMGAPYPGAIVEYTGTNTYYSRSSGENKAETYVPLEGSSRGKGYSDIPLNCRKLLVPTVHSR